MRQEVVPPRKGWFLLVTESQEAKQCALCKKHGGAQNTHNTGDCKKYNSDDTPKKGFTGKNVHQKTNYAQ